MGPEIYEHRCKERTSGYSHDGKYNIVSECRMKNPVHGEWVDGIIYQDINDKSKLFVRDKKEFFKKLKIVKHES